MVTKNTLEEFKIDLNNLGNNLIFGGTIPDSKGSGEQITINYLLCILICIIGAAL
jgi:hypothetical protein